MRTEKIERIAKKMRESGCGWISQDDCRKIVMLVQNELLLDVVFAPLPEHTLIPADAEHERLRGVEE